MTYLPMKCSSVTQVRHDLFYSQSKGRALTAPFVYIDEDAPGGPLGLHIVIEVISTTITRQFHSH